MYKEILEAIEKDPSIDVFTLEQQLGAKDIEKTLELKSKSLIPKEVIEKISNLRTQRAERSSYDGAGYPLEKAKKAIFQCLEVRPLNIEVASAGVDADFAIPCFAAAKAKGVNSNKFASEIAETISKSNISYVKSTSVSGGYANIKFDMEKFGDEVLMSVADLRDWYGAGSDGIDKSVIIEYSSPNAAKPMSVGHLRSTIIGAAIQRLYEFQGYKAIGINHFGDYGTQFGKLLFAFTEWGDENELKKDPIKTMLKLYVRFHEEAKNNEELEEKAREIFKKLESGDPELIKKWAEFCEISMRDFEKIYQMLGVKIDLTLGESFYEKQLDEAINACLERKIAVNNDDGSVAVNFSDESLPSYLLRKKDGSSLYATRDIAAARFRIKTFDPEKIIYVVGSEQALHFRQIFKTLGLLEYDERKFSHAAFGMVSLPEGKMSTREGRVVFLEDLISEAKVRAKNIVEQKNHELSGEEKDKIAEAVGIGAVIYSDLSQSMGKNIVFSWDKALSLEGDSAPYLQYTYARAKSILRKAGGKEFAPATDEKTTITTEREKNLILLIARFPDISKQAAIFSAPHSIAEYLNDLAQAFNRFYAQDPVLDADLGIKNTRLAIVYATAQVVKNGLTLLGIKTLERM
ncbi:MAG: arginine--tRNA ligase [Patescibacteria group bacterium]